MTLFINTSLLAPPIQPERLAWPQKLAGNSEGAREIWQWFQWQFFSILIFISKVVSNLHKNFCHITWHQKPTLVLLRDTYIQKLNNQEHTCNWVRICKRQQLAPLPDEIPSCSSHFHGSQNCACRCRLKKRWRYKLLDKYLCVVISEITLDFVCVSLTYTHAINTKVVLNR